MKCKRATVCVYYYVPPEGLAWVSGASSWWRQCPGTCTGTFRDLSWGSTRPRNRRTRMKPADQRDIAWARQIRQIENYISENEKIKDRLQLTLPDVLIGLETWRLHMLSNERGDSVPDLLRNSLDILSLPILKQKEWNSLSLVSTGGYIYILEEDYAISIFFSILKVFFSFSKTKWNRIK